MLRSLRQPHCQRRLWFLGSGCPGPLPPLPASLLIMDVGSNLGLSGDISGLEVGSLVELRLGNNSFTGGIPPSATKSQ